MRTSVLPRSHRGRRTRDGVGAPGRGRSGQFDNVIGHLISAMVLAAGSLPVTLASVVSVSPAWAETRTPAQATAHALDELANCRAQAANRGRVDPTCLPDTATPTPAPTDTPTPVPEPPTATPAIEPDRPTPQPALPAVNFDNRLFGYFRPANGYAQVEDVGEVVELALPQGRWIVALQCDSDPPPWSSAWLFTEGANSYVADDAYIAAPDGEPPCRIAQWLWQSNTPCTMNDSGTCAVMADDSYWQAIADELANATLTPTDVATSTPHPLQSTSRPTQSVPAATLQVEVRTVVQTVVVEVTAVPSDTTSATPTRLASATQRPTVTPSPARTASPNTTVTRTPIPPAAALPTLGPRVQGAVSPPAPGHWDWGPFLRAAALLVLVGALAAWLLTRRRVVRWGARSEPMEETHA